MMASAGDDDENTAAAIPKAKRNGNISVHGGSHAAPANTSIPVLIGVAKGCHYVLRPCVAHDENSRLSQLPAAKFPGALFYL